jgi:hypothetical protein
MRSDRHEERCIASDAFRIGGVCNHRGAEFVGPSGRGAYLMDCSGMGRTINACYQKAGQLCPAGYNIVSQSSTPVDIPTMYGTLIASDEKMAVECK